MSHLKPQLSPTSSLRRLPRPIKRVLNDAYWLGRDAIDFFAEAIGWLPFHWLRIFMYRLFLGLPIGEGTSVHRGCRFYRPGGIRIGRHTVINRDVLLDGRMSLVIGDNVSISEGCMILSLEHDPGSPTFDNRGGKVTIGDRVFMGARAIILPGVTIGEGAVVAAGAVVSSDVAAFDIVGGVPARKISSRSKDLSYTLNYRKFLG